MENCIFCKIVKGEIPSYTIYENDRIKVFMDINPIAKGHCLVIPKNHYTNLMDIDKDVLRIAIVELVFIKDAPHKVIIDEALELAKKYSTDDSPSFINGILARVVEKYV